MSLALQILRIPVNQEMITYKCGTEPCKDFVATVVKKAKDETEQEQEMTAPLSEKDLKLPVNLDPLKSITAPVQKAKETLNSATDKASIAASTIASNALSGAITGALTGQAAVNSRIKKGGRTPRKKFIA
jgi:hypothetical protein